MEFRVFYVEGNARDSDEGHAWNIVEINGEQYYVDATNGDQPAFLEGGAVSLEEHKTTIYDICVLFHRNMSNYIQHPMNFRFRMCTATDLNFYVLNQACFDTYDEQQIYEFSAVCVFENGAAVSTFQIYFAGSF
mgnify:CR=1 FL=1